MNNNKKRWRVRTDNRVISIGIVCLMVLGCLVEIINFSDNNVNADGSGNYPPPGLGDWLIVTETYVGNETIILNGNLIITATGSLTLNNVTLLINCAFDGQNRIEVESGGWLNITNECNITVFNVNFNYYIKVNSGSNFKMEDSSVSYAGYEWGTNGDRTGLWVNSTDSLINNCTITNNYFGIMPYSNSSTTISNNNIHSNDCYGIYLYESSNNTISNNHVYSNNEDGIALQQSSNNTISNNDVYSNNQKGISLYGGSYDNTVSHNNVHSNNWDGISLFWGSHSNTISNNNISNNMRGIYLLQNSNGNTISNNTIHSNNMEGIFLYQSSNGNTISNNNISNNNDGIRLYLSSNTTIINNTFLNNSIVISERSLDLGLLEYWNTHTMTNNIANGRPIYYYKNENGIAVPSDAIEVILANCTGFLIQGINTSNIDIGILLGYSDGNIIDASNISNNDKGMYIYSSSNNIISNNNVYSNKVYGIELHQNSIGNTISNNNIYSNSIMGIRLYIDCNNNTISNNNVYSNNMDGIHINRNSNNNVIFNNHISNHVNGILIVGTSSNNTISTNDIYSNWGQGLEVYVGSNNNTISNNNIYSNSIEGILIRSYSNGNTISNNNIHSNGENGIEVFRESNDNTISNNNIYSNGEDGIGVFKSCSGNTISNNRISNNLRGINISGIEISFNNLIYHNSFIDNVNQALDDTLWGNKWDNDYPSGGNYWSDYTGPDNFNGPFQDIPGSDGIGDIPYYITGGFCQDRYPLVPLQPTLYININQDKKDVILSWDPLLILSIDHYLLYRSTSQTDFNFNTIWVNTSADKEPGEPGPNPLRTMWNDTNAAFPGNDTNYQEQYYYIIRAVKVNGEVSRTSRTVGKWTKPFPKGVSTFSLPLEPIERFYTDYYTSDMSAEYIKYIDSGSHTWRQHNLGDGTTNNTQMKLGEGYEVKFASQTNYTFTGMPGAMISYDDDSGFLGFDHITEAKNHTVTVEQDGNVTITWQEPASMGIGDWYEIYYSNTRDGFFGKLESDYFLACSSVYFGNNTATHLGALANNPGARLYYMVVPFNTSGIRGASTYSIGIWTEEYLSQYDTIGIPLKLSSYQTVDWFCDNIPDTVGINYYIYTQKRWGWHSTRMPQGAYDPMLVMAEGYQISTSGATKFTFIGV